MFGIKSNKLEAWFATLPAATREKLEKTSPEEWNSVLASVLSDNVKGKQVNGTSDRQGKQETHVEKATEVAKNLGVVSVSILSRELAVDEEKAREMLKELEAKGIVEHGEAHAIRKVYNPNVELELDDAVVSDIVAHLLEHQTISVEILKNKFAVSEKMTPIVLDALEESGFISA